MFGEKVTARTMQVAPGTVQVTLSSGCIGVGPPRSQCRPSVRRVKQASSAYRIGETVEHRGGG